jgi:WD40 repeat protein
MWDTKTGAPLSGFPQTRDWSNCRTAAISPDGKLLAVVHRYRYGFEICDLPSGKPRFRQGADDWRVDYGYYCLAAFSQDSKTFCLSNQFDVSYWDVETGRKKHQFTDPEGYHYIASISSTSEKMLTTHRSGLRVRDLATGKIVQSLEDSGGLVQRSQLSADGTKLVATYKPEDRIYAWDAVRGKLLGEIALKADVVHGDPRPSFALSQDGIQLALCDCVAKGNAAQQIQVWNLANLDLKPRILTPPPGVGQVVDFAPDGQTLLWRVGTSYRLLDSATGKDRHGWPSRGAVIGVAWSPDGSRIATGAVDGTVSIWHPDGKRLNTLIGHRAGTGRLVFSPNSQLLVSCGAHKEPAILWDAISGAKKAELDNNRSRLPGVYWAGFSPDSTLLYTGGNSIKRGIFETATGKLQSEFETDRSSTWHMAFSADGRFAAAGIDSIGLYDLVAKRIRHTLDSQQCVSHAFSHDGHTLAVLNNGRGDQGQLVLWETLTGRERTRLAFSKAYLAAGRLAFSPDGRMLAAVASGQFQIWDLASRNPMGQLPGHLDRITCVAFSPDSRSLATGSSDGAVLIHAIAPR